jgi:hypothetical protein
MGIQCQCCQASYIRQRVEDRVVIERGLRGGRAIGLFLLVLLVQGPAYAVERSYIVPASKRSDAVLLVDPGVTGLPGGLKIQRLELPEFKVTFSGPAGRLSVQIHPASVVLGKKPLWKGKNVAVTLWGTTLKPDDRNAAVEAFLVNLKAREGRWGWLWRPKLKRTPSTGSLEALTKLHRALALGEYTKVRGAVHTITRKSVNVGVLLEGARLLYWAGSVPEGRALGARASKLVAKNLVKPKASLGPGLKLLAAQAFALEGKGQRAMGVARAILMRPAACRISRVARDLDIAGFGEEALVLVKDILRNRSGCGPAHLLEQQLTRAWARVGSSAAPVKIARQRIDDVAALLQRSPYHPWAFDLFAMLIFSGPADAVAARIARDAARFSPAKLGLQMIAGIRCASVGDFVCVNAVVTRTEQRKGAIRQPLLGLMRIVVEPGKQENSAERDKWVTSAWQEAPGTLLPLYTELLVAQRQGDPTTQLSTIFRGALKQRYGLDMKDDAVGVIRTGTTSSRPSQPASATSGSHLPVFIAIICVLILALLGGIVRSRRGK